MEGYNIAIGFNDNIQIDTEHILVGSDFVTQATNWQKAHSWGSSKPYYCILPAPSGRNNIIAFKPSTNDYSIATHKAIIYYNYWVGDVFHYEQVPHNTPIVIRSTDYSDAITCNIFTIGNLNNMVKPNYGMMIYDASGNVIYNSDCKILKISEIFEVNINSLPVTITHNSVDPYYIVPYMTKMWHSAGHFNPNIGLIEYYLDYYTVGIKKLSSTQISVNWFIYVDDGLLETPYLTNNEGWVNSYYTPFRIAVCNID